MKLSRALLITIIYFLIIFGCKNSSPTESNDPTVITFSDSKFEEVIREILNKPTGDITKEDMLSIYELSGIEREIVNIDGIEYCENLTYLRIRNNRISDISPIANFKNLDYLNIRNNQITKLDALENLTSLTFLNFDSNQITDISVLSNLTNLRTLWGGYNQYSDINSLKNLINLYKIGIDDNQISDILPLVQNQGIGSGDIIFLTLNPLNNTSLNEYIPQLVARGVTVYN